MKEKLYTKFAFILVIILFLTTGVKAQIVPTITGPAGAGMPESVGDGVTTAIYSTEPGQTGYVWSVSSAGINIVGQGTSSISVDWTNPTGQQFVSVVYDGAVTATLIINYFPFAPPIDPAAIPQFVDPLPHFAAGLRVNAKAGGNLTIRTELVQQVALPTGMVLPAGTIGDPATPNAGKGNYAAYNISTDGGATWGIPMWPAQTIEVQKGNPLTINWENGLVNVRYSAFNILADQTLMMKGYLLNGDPLTEPYNGDIPMVVHLHGGEINSDSDGGPLAWFTPNHAQEGPAFKYFTSSTTTYPNLQDEATIWYHPHDDGLTRINVYTGLAGFYFIRGPMEEAAQFPGHKFDDLVREITPADPVTDPISGTAIPRATTFNGTNAYLPEIEVAIQDRMFDVNGQLYWPVAPPNPELHPFWTPEFVGDIMTVNGKAWPYLSVAPRKYRFRLLDGCNARWLNLWLVNAVDGTPGPAFTVVGGDGGLLESPVTIDPATGGTLLIGPGQRYDIVIDFVGVTPGAKFILMNDASTPYPFGDPVVPGTTDRIMQFVVNGEMVSAGDPAVPGVDKTGDLLNLRGSNPLVKLTDFNGGLAPGVTPAVTRQIILNEVMAANGPASVQVNNSYFDTELQIIGSPNTAGGPTEFMQEGTTEIIQIANVSADAHPMHIHLMQWQLVSRQPIDDIRYLADYAAAWLPRGLQNFPVGMEYPGGAGSPYDYNIPNADGALGGNPAFSSYINGPVIPALPEEMGWKDNTTVLPGMVSTFVVRVAPTDIPVNATPEQLLLPFDPSLGPGYVWHCHVIDHEDMSMMRPLVILPSPVRFPQVTTQPASKAACIGDPKVSFSVAGTSVSAITYQWEISTDAGLTWTPIADNATFAGSQTAGLDILAPAVALSNSQYRCLLTNIDGTTTSSFATLTVNDCFISGTLNYNNVALDPLAGFTVSVNGKTAITDALGAFTIPAVTSGTNPVTITGPIAPGGINATDAGTVNAWVNAPSAIPSVKYLAGDVDKLSLSTLDASAIQQNFVSGAAFVQAPWVFYDALTTASTIPQPFAATVNGAPVIGLNILGMATGDFNGSFNPNVVGGVSGVVLSPSGLAIKAAAGAPFDLPLVAVTNLQVGAISLILNVPGGLVSVNNVTVPGSANPVAFNYNVTTGLLSIAWNSITPVNVLAGQPLVLINMTSTAAFTNSQTLRVTLVANYLNELADALFSPIINPSLTVDNVQVSAKGTNTATILLSASPNPATTFTNITYTIPVAGNVSLDFYDSKGTLMLNVQSNLPVAAGVATTLSGVDVTRLTKGNYYLRLTLTVPGSSAQTTSIKFIKK